MKRLPPIAIAIAIGLSHSGRAQDTALPQETFARVNGKDVSREEYRRWLEKTHGWRFAEDFLFLVLLRQEARKLGIEWTPANIDQAVEDDWKNHVWFRYEGNEERFLEDLAAIGMDREGHLRRRRPLVERDFLAYAVLKRRRDPTEDQLRKIHAIEFGPDAERLHVKVAYFNKYYGVELNNTPATEVVQKLDVKARQQAEKFAAKVRENPSRFGELIQTSDPLLVEQSDSWVRDLRNSGGDLPRFRSELFFGALDEVVAAEDFQPGKLIGPVAASAGYYVVLCVEREPAPFEAVKEELREYFQNRRPGAREIHFLKLELLDEATIQR